MMLLGKTVYGRATALRPVRGWAMGSVGRIGGPYPRPVQATNTRTVPLFSSANAPRPLRKFLSDEAQFSAMGVEHGGEAMLKQAPRLEWVLSPSVRDILGSFHEVMVRDRRPLQFLGLRSRTNLSNLCGHASFVALAFAYLETDVLMLRGYAASGIGLSILFQFYRAQPLWIPIGWNGLFMLINVSMILLLLKEQNDAGKIWENPEQEKVFREVFMPVELSPVDFVRLADLAERRVIRKGGLLSKAGVVQEELFLMVEGTAEVKSDGMLVGHLDPRQFVGSMAFQQFITNHASSAYASDSEAKLAVTNPLLSKKDGALPAGVWVEKGSEKAQGRTADSAGVLGEAKKAGAAALEMLCKESIVGVMAKSLLPETRVVSAGEAGGGRGGSLWSTPLGASSTTVAATTDVVVYAWDMHLLRAYIRRPPAAGVAVQTAMSADLTRKVDQSRGNLERYRSWLTEALAGGEITPIEKKKLRRFREEHGISLTEHRALLQQNVWTEEEFGAGFQKGVAPRDGSKDLLKYEALVQRELANGQIQGDTREHLRRFRARAGIDAQEHLLVLNKQGWTADDYEVGHKSVAGPTKGQAPAKKEQLQSFAIVRTNGRSFSADGAHIVRKPRLIAKGVSN